MPSPLSSSSSSTAAAAAAASFVAFPALQGYGNGNGNGQHNLAPDEDLFHDVPADQPFFFTLANSTAAANSNTTVFPASPGSDSSNNNNNNNNKQGGGGGGGEENDDTASSPSSSVCALPSSYQNPATVVTEQPQPEKQQQHQPEKQPLHASPRKRLDRKNYFFLLQQHSSKRLIKEDNAAAAAAAAEEEEKSDKHSPAAPPPVSRGSGDVAAKSSSSSGGKMASSLRKRSTVRRATAPPPPNNNNNNRGGGVGGGRFFSSLNKGVRGGRGGGGNTSSNRRGSNNNKKSSSASTGASSASSPSTTRGGGRGGTLLRGIHSNTNIINNNDASSLQNSDNDKDILMQEPDDDPVMAVFEARSKQRVRFAVEQGNNEVGAADDAGNNSTNSCFGSGCSGDAGDADNIQLLGGGEGHNAAVTAAVAAALAATAATTTTTTSNAAAASSPSTNNINIGTNSPTTSTMSIKKFMRGALFTSSYLKKNSKDANNNSNNNNKAMIDAEVQKEIETLQDEGFWEESAAPVENGKNNDSNSSSAPQGLRSKNAGNSNANCWTAGRAMLSSSSSSSPVFIENQATRAAVIKLLNKARRAQFVYFRYEYAVKCYVKALDLLTRQDHYPQDHPVVIKTFVALNNAHHALSSLKNSASIVKMGIRYEDTGELVRALKMYTIAYRIRRDSLSPSHPSLVVLLNMLGSIQMKRGELEEAMQIFELALKDPNTNNNAGGASDNSSTTSGHNDNNNNNNNIGQPPSVSSADSRNSSSPFHPSFDDDAKQGKQQQPQQQPEQEPNGNLLARSVTYREMGTVYEKWGEMDAALHMFHKSLDCIGQAKAMQQKQFREQSPQQHHNTSRRGKQQQEHNGNDDSFEEESLLISNQDLLVLDTSISEVFASLESEDATKAAGAKKKSPTSSPKRSSSSSTSVVNQSTRTAKATGGDDGMEIVIGTIAPNGSSSNRTPATSPTHGKQKFGRDGNKSTTTIGVSNTMPMVVMSSNNYDSFFPPELDEIIKRTKASSGGNFGRKSASSSGDADAGGGKCSDYADVDAALTLHQIAQLHRTQGNFRKALAAFIVSLRGMKYCLGKNHPNVAAILGNIGNLQKEMGDMDAAFETYQQVLGIESYRLGLSHPDVAVTLHNIATIDAARGNHEHALALYRQVVSLQRKLFGPDHVSVAVTSACMGDVLERIGATKQATDCFEEATRIKTISMGRHSLEVARLLHKLGKLALAQNDFHLADSYVSRAILIYRLNKLADDDEWMIDACRDAADVDAAIAMGKGIQFEC